MSNPNVFDKDVTIQNRLFVKQDVIVTGDSVTLGDMNVINDSNTNGRVFIQGNTYLYKNLSVAGDIQVKNLNVSGMFNANYPNDSIPKAAIIGSSTFDNDLTVGGKLSVKNIETTAEIIVNTDLTTNRLFVKNDVTNKQRLFVENDATLKKRIFVTGSSEFSNDALIKGNLTIVGDVSMNYLPNTVPSNAVISRNIYDDDLIANNRLFVANTAEFSKKVVMKDDISLNKNIMIGGNTTINNLLTVKDIAITGNLAFNSFANSSIPSTAIIGGALPGNAFETDVSLGQQLLVSGIITAKNKLNIENDASFNRSLRVGGNVTIGNALTVKDINVSGNLAFNNFANSSIPSAAIIGGVLPANAFSANVSLDQQLLVAGQITTRNNLNVENDASFNRVVKVGGAVTLGNTLAVAEAATFAKDVTIAGNLNANFADSSIPSSKIVGGVLPANTFATDVSMNRRLFVYDDITTKDKLFVEGDASFNQVVKVGGAVTLGNTLAVAESATFAKDVTITGNLNAGFADFSIQPSKIFGGVLPANTFATDVSMNQRLFVYDDITTKDKLFVEGDASFNRTLRVGGSVTLGNTLAVAEAATFANNVTISGNLNANFANSSIPSSAIVGGVLSANTFAADVSMNQRLFVYDDITTKDKLFVEGDASFNRTMRVGGAVTLGNTLNVAETATFARDLTVSGNLNANFANSTIPSSAIVGGALPANTFAADVSMNQQLLVTGVITAKNKLNVESDVSFNRTMRVGGAVTLVNTLNVAESATFARDLTVSGNLNANFANSSIPSSAIVGGALPANTLNNDVTFAQKTVTNGDASFNGKINVANDATFNRLIIANGEIRAQNGLVVTGSTVSNTITTNRLNVLTDTSFNGNVYVDKDLTIYGRLNVQQYTNSSVINTTTVNYATIVTEDLSVNGNITIESTSNLNRLNVTNDASFGKAIIAAGDIRAQNRLFVLGDASIGGILTASFNDSSIPSSKIIGGALPANTLNNDVVFAQKIIATGDASFNNGITVANDALFNKIIRVSGDIRGQNRLFVIGDASIGGILTASFNDSTIPSSKIIGGVLPANTLNNDVVFAQRIIANGDASFNEKLRVANDAAFNKLITVTGDIRAQNRIFVVGDAQVNGTLTASLIVGSFNDSSIPSSKIIGGVLPANTFSNDVTFAQKIITGGDASFNGAMQVANDATFNKMVIASGDIRAQNRLFVTRDASFNGNVNITGNLTANYPENSIPQSAVIGLLSGNQSASNIAFDTDINMQKRLFVASDVSSNGVLYVSGAGTSIVKNNLTVGGTFSAASYAANSIPTSAINGLSAIVNAATSAPNFSEDVSMNKRLFVTSDVSSNGRLYVSGAGTSIIKNNLTVGGTFTAASYPDNSIPAAAITGLTTLINNSSAVPNFSEDVSMNKRLFVTGDVSSNGLLYVSGAGTSIIKNNLTVSGTFSAASYVANSIPTSAINGLTALINSTSTIPNFGEDVSMNKRLFVTGDVSSNGLLYVSGAGTSIIKNNLTVGNLINTAAITASGTLGVTGQTTLTDVAASNVTISGNLSVNGTTTTINATNLDISDNLIMISAGFTGTPANDSGILINRGNQSNVFMGWDESAKSFILGDTTATSLSTGNLSITPGTLSINDALLNGRLFVGTNSFMVGDVSMSAKLTVAGTTALNDNVTIAAGKTFTVGTGGTTLGGVLAVTGAATLASTLAVNNAATLASTLAVTGASTFIGATTHTGTLLVSSATTLGTTLAVTGAATLASTLSVANSAALASTLSVANATTLASTLAVTGASTFIGATTHTGTLLVNNATTLGTTLAVTGAATLASTLSVANAAALASTLSVANATTLASTLSVTGAATLASTLAVTGASTFIGPTTHTGTLLVSSATTLGTTLAVTGAATLASTLAVANSAALASTLSVANAATLASTLAVTGAATLASALAVTGATTLASTLSVANASTLASTLSVANATTLASILAVTGATTLASTLAVTGASTFIGPTTHTGTLLVSSATTLGTTLAVTGAATLAGALAVTGATALASTLSVSNAATLASTLSVANATTLASILAVTGATTLASTLAVTGASTFIGPTTHTGTLLVSSATTLATTLAVTGAATLASTLAVTGAATLASTLAVTGAATLASTLAVTGATALASTLSVANATTLASTLAVTGKAVLNSDVSMNANIDIFGNVNIGKSLVVIGAINLTGDVSLNRRLFVASDISVNGISIGRGNSDISTNTRFGINTLQSVTGANNTGFGSNSMALLTGGNQNTAFGTNALSNSTTANRNTAVGYHALKGTNSNDATTNTAIGANAGENNSLGSNLTFLGADTDVSGSTINYQNSTAIGKGAVITESNQMVLGAPNQNLNIFLNANRMSGVRSNIIDVSLINFTVESIPASAIIGSSGTSTALTGAVFIENTLSVNNLATFKDNISVLGSGSIGNGLVLSGNLIATDNANIGGNLIVPSINDMLTFVTYSDVPIASGLASANIDLATAWNQQSGSSGLPLGNWLGGLISETGQYQYMYDKLNPTKIYRSITYGTTFEQKSLVASIYDGVNNGNNINNVIAMDYTGKYVAFGGNKSISYSSNFGLTFNELSNTIVNGNGSNISTIALSGTGKFMFVGGTNSQLFVSTDSGTLVSVDSSPIFDQQYNYWKSISTNGSGLLSMAITTTKIFITDPSNATIYNGLWLNKTASKHANMVLANVTDSFISNDGVTFGITTTTGLYISKNQGTSWTEYAIANGYNSAAYTYTRSPLLDGAYIYLTTTNSGKLKKSINALVSISIADGSGTGMPSTTYSSVIVSGNGGYTYLFDGANISYRPYLQINTGGATVRVPSGTAFVLDKDAEIKQNLIVTKDTSIINRLFVSSDVSLNQKLFVANDVSMNGNVGISNNLRVTGNITMNGGSLNTTDTTETVTIFDAASVINLGGTSTNINIGTGAGTSTTVTIGANNDTVNILGNLNITGTTTTISTVNLDISDNAITLNKGGPDATLVGAGINIDASGVLSVGYIRVDADTARFVVRLPLLAGGTPQYIATKDNANDLSANNFTTNGNITMAGSGSLLMTGKYIKQF